MAIRLRPFTEKEKQKNSRRIVDIEQNTAILYSPKHGDLTNLKKFTFDHSYWSHDGFKRNQDGVNVPDLSQPNGEKYVSQERVFEDLGQFLLSNALEGYNSALLAYGQTGSGKSYTVTGYGQNEGIVPRFARALFEELDKKAQALSQVGADEVANNGLRYEVYFSMLEIYNEVVRDLLAKNHGHLVTQATFARRGLKVREHPKHGFFVENLTSYACADKFEIERRIEEGQLNKSIAATSMNETSSRGHTIYEFRIKQYKQLPSGAAENQQDETVTTSVVQLVDLAGSERLAVHVTGQLGGDSFIASRASSPYPRSATKGTGAGASPWAKTSADQRAPSTGGSRRAKNSAESGASGTNGAHPNNQHLQRFKESVSINQSLSALGNCIQVLSQYSQQMEAANGAASKKAAPKIPYRDSMLTKLLNRCCLSGNSKVVIIATLSPAETNYDDTLCTLRFADRAKQIRTHATINLMSRSQVVDNLQKENERLKQLVGDNGRVTRSDDSSQTSNFDDSENVMENFAGSKIIGGKRAPGAANDQVRTKTTVRKSRNDRFHESQAKSLRSSPKLSAGSSNPSLQIKEQMKRLVSPASRKMLDGHKMSPSGRMVKSKSMAQVGADLAINDDDDDDDPNFEADINDDLDDIKEGLISPESDEDSVALALDEMNDEEKIGMFNKMLSNSMSVRTMASINLPTSPKSQVDDNNLAPSSKTKKMARPKRGNNKGGASMRHTQVSMLSSSLRKSNPYISNLNMDEQLTGVISYIIKQGETVVGKSNECDIVLHGTEMRSRHALIKRATSGNKSREVFIEPVLAQDEVGGQSVALMVNGSPVAAKTKLHHGDRLLFGTNAYFVYIDHSEPGAASVDLGAITFHVAQNEALRKLMSEEKNEAVIKEINGYSYRPGTGKAHRALKSAESKDATGSRRRPSKDHQTRETVSTSKHEPELESAVSDRLASGQKENDDEDIESQEAKYRDQLIEDTYEYAMPVAEVNAVSKEMGVKVSYELKILTGDEQLLGLGAPISEPGLAATDSSTSDGFSSSSAAGDDSNRAQNERVTYLSKLDAFDVPPALFIKVHLDEQGVDFYWSKEKFQARRFKILELYGAWDVGEKAGLVEHLIDLSSVQGHYLIDPFVDDARSMPVLIGHAQVTLRPILHLTNIDQSYDILDLDDRVAGSIKIHATPCYNDEVQGGQNEPFRVYSDEDLKKRPIEDPSELLGKKLVFVLKIKSCSDIPDNYTNIYCQYSLQSDGSSIRTKVLRETDTLSELTNMDSALDNNTSTTGSLEFDHSHYICVERVTEEIIDFFDYGFLTIQVVGHHKLSDTASKSPTVVSTIINSINKFKYKLEQQGQQYNGSDYSPTAFYNSDSARSQRGPSGSGPAGMNSGASSVVSATTTANLFDQQDDEAGNSIGGGSQENVIDMILTKRKLERAENQLHYLKRTINIAEHYNKKHVSTRPRSC